MKSKNGKPLVIFILIPLLLISCASAPKYRISMETLEDFEQTVIALGFGRTWNQHVYITAVLQGRSYRLLLDTGFYGVLGLKPDVLDELNLPVVGEVTYRDAEGTMYHAREVVVPAVQIGDLQFTELRAQEDFYGPEEFDGQIGLGLLTHFDVLMDYRSRSMTLYPRSHQLEGVDSGIWFGAALVEGLNIRIRMSPSAEDYLVGIDTGSNAFAMPKDSDLAIGIIEEQGLVDENRIVNQRNQQEVYRYVIDDFLVEEFALGEMVVIMADMASYMGNGMLGYDFFNNNTVYFDFDRDLIYLRSSSGR